jgi:F0F1-type ATP synthase assembly protein I
METLTKILKFIASVIIGVGSWYLIGWFLSSQPNPLQWTIFGKIVFLVLVVNSVITINDELDG